MPALLCRRDSGRASRSPASGVGRAVRASRSTWRAPLETLYDAAEGCPLPLPPELATLYGRLTFPLIQGRPYVIANFVTTLDGIVSLGVPGQEGGAEISGFNQHDRMVMGLLRAVADAVVVGAGTPRASPRHRRSSSGRQ